MGIGDREFSSPKRAAPETPSTPPARRRGAWRAPSTWSTVSVRRIALKGRKRRTPYAPPGRRSGLLAFRFLVVTLVLFSIPLPTSAADMHHAAVVVHHGNGGVTYAYVAFSENEIDGAELLKRADLGAVTISFGGLGDGICMIEKEGCPPAECQKRMCQNGSADSPFWQFYQLGSGGDWQIAALGASSVKLRDGDVSGWSWTGAGANLPATSFAQIDTLAAQKAGGDGTALVWRTGPARPTDASQSWVAFAEGAAVVTVAIGVASVIIVRKRRVLPAGLFRDE